MNTMLLPTRISSLAARFAGAAFAVAFGVAALGAVALSAPSSAQAAECSNGYRMLGNDVIVACRAGDAASSATALFPNTSQRPVPAVTGALPHRAGSVMAGDAGQCGPGQYRMLYYGSSGGLMLRCQ